LPKIAISIPINYCSSWFCNLQMLANIAHCWARPRHRLLREGSVFRWLPGNKFNRLPIWADSPWFCIVTVTERLNRLWKTSVSRHLIVFINSNFIHIFVIWHFTINLLSNFAQSQLITLSVKEQFIINCKFICNSV
jgi:hypothetical protein